MGYQESYIQFRDFNLLVHELERYSKRDTSEDLARVIGTVQVLKDYRCFTQDEICLVTAGERSEQRSPQCLREGLGIIGATNIEYIDDLFTYDDPPYDEVPGFKLDDYFKFKPL